MFLFHVFDLPSNYRKLRLYSLMYFIHRKERMSMFRRSLKACDVIQCLRRRCTRFTTAFFVCADPNGGDSTVTHSVYIYDVWLLLALESAMSTFARNELKFLSIPSMALRQERTVCLLKILLFAFPRLSYFYFI